MRWQIFAAAQCGASHEVMFIMRWLHGKQVRYLVLLKGSARRGARTESMSQGSGMKVDT